MLYSEKKQNKNDIDMPLTVSRLRTPFEGSMMRRGRAELSSNTTGP